MTAPTPLICANRPCASPATRPCTKCHLVKYCSPTCCIAHQSAHSALCNHPLSKPSWKPSFHLNYTPGFLSEGPLFSVNPFPTNVIRLWSTQLALGYGTLSRNVVAKVCEVLKDQPAELLFATEDGNLEDAATIVERLFKELDNPPPKNAHRREQQKSTSSQESTETSGQSTPIPSATINKTILTFHEHHPELAIRIILVILLLLRNHVLHAVEVFCNTTISKEASMAMNQVVDNLINGKCGSTLLKKLLQGEQVDNEVVSMFAPCRSFGGGEMTISLPMKVWRKLIRISRSGDVNGKKLPKEMEQKWIKKTLEERVGVMRCADRRDWWEKDLYAAPPEWRAALDEWAKEGNLRSMQGVEEATEGRKMNRTMFDIQTLSYLGAETNTPLSAYPTRIYTSARNSGSPYAENDIFGHLQHHIHILFTHFASHLRSTRLAVKVSTGNFIPNPPSGGFAIISTSTLTSLNSRPLLAPTGLLIQSRPVSISNLAWPPLNRKGIDPLFVATTAMQHLNHSRGFQIYTINDLKATEEGMMHKDVVKGEQWMAAIMTAFQALPIGFRKGEVAEKYVDWSKVRRLIEIIKKGEGVGEAAKRLGRELEVLSALRRGGVMRRVAAVNERDISKNAARMSVGVTVNTKKANTKMEDIKAPAVELLDANIANASTQNKKITNRKTANVERAHNSVTDENKTDKKKEVKQQIGGKNENKVKNGGKGDGFTLTGEKPTNITLTENGRDRADGSKEKDIRGIRTKSMGRGRDRGGNADEGFWRRGKPAPAKKKETAGGNTWVWI